MATYFTAAIPRINNQDADPALAGKPDRESVDDLDSYRGSLGGQRLLAHESAANDALTQYRLQALRALGDYGGLRGKDAIDGHDAYRQTLQDNRDRVFAKLPGAAQALLQPHLDRQHHEDLHFGMAHRAQQDKEWATKSALDALEADKREAMLRPGDLSLLQKLAERSDAEWMKIGQREGWLDDLVLRNAERSKADLIGRVILTQLQKGDQAGAQHTWQFAQNHVDPKTIIDAMRNKVIPGQEQPYDGGNPMLGDNANVRPQDVQLRSPGGQQFAQVQKPRGANQTVPTQTGQKGQARGLPSPALNTKPKSKAQMERERPKDSVRTLPDPDTSNGSPHSTKPDFDPKAPPRNMTKLDSRASAVNASIEDSTDANAGLNQPKKILLRDWQNNLVPTETTGQPRTVYTKEDNDRADKFLDDVFANRVGNEDWNIGHVNWSKDDWVGKANRSWRDFETVLTPEEGVRMAYINLKNMLIRIGDKRAAGKTGQAAEDARKLTLDDIAPVWTSTARGDNPNRWAYNISNRSGLKQNEIIDINNVEQMSRLLHGMHVSEVAGNGFAPEVYTAGIKMAKGAPPPIKSFDQRMFELYTIAMSDHDTQELRPLIFQKFMKVMRDGRKALNSNSKLDLPEDDRLGPSRY